MQDTCQVFLEKNMYFICILFEKIYYIEKFT